MRNLKIGKIIVLLLILTVGLAAGSKNITAQNNQNGVKKVSDHILKRRFGEFSTCGALVLIKVQNTKNREQMTIVCENETWESVCEDDLKLVPDIDEYTGYMVRNANTVFQLNDQTYSKLKSHKAGNSYSEASKKGWDYIKKEFLKPDRKFLKIKDKSLARNNDFLRMLLEQNVVVRVGCYAGEVYVENF